MADTQETKWKVYRESSPVGKAFDAYEKAVSYVASRYLSEHRGKYYDRHCRAAFLEPYLLERYLLDGVPLKQAKRRAYLLARQEDENDTLLSSAARHYARKDRGIKDWRIVEKKVSPEQVPKPSTTPPKAAPAEAPKLAKPTLASYYNVLLDQ